MPAQFPSGPVSTSEGALGDPSGMPMIPASTLDEASAGSGTHVPSEVTDASHEAMANEIVSTAERSRPSRVRPDGATTQSYVGAVRPCDHKSEPRQSVRTKGDLPLLLPPAASGALFRDRPWPERAMLRMKKNWLALASL